MHRIGPFGSLVRTTAALFGVMMLAASCGGAEAEGTTWRLATLGDAEAIPKSGAGFTASDGQVSGYTGCNSFNGPVTIDGDSIAVGPLAATLAGCPDPALTAQESGFLEALQGATSHSVDGDVLSLIDEGEVLAMFERFVPSVVGSWRVVGYHNGQEAVVSVIPGTTITAGFDEEGMVSGSGGCNEYSGDYEAGDGDITIGPLAATERACLEPAGAMDQEQRFLAAFESAETWSLDGNTLTLRNGDDATAVTLTPND